MPGLTLSRYSPAVLSRVKAVVEQAPSVHHERILRTIYPNITDKMVGRAIESVAYNLFIRRMPTDIEILSPSLGFLREDRNFLITDEERFMTLPAQRQKQFYPVPVLESRSHRSKFWLDENGVPHEFKGLTPMHFDIHDVNINSHQPNGLLVINPGCQEADGLQIIGEIDSDVTNLGRYFPDMAGFAQIYRRGIPGNRYLPWLRMDVSEYVFQMMADLEGKTLEQFLYESSQRYGRQLRDLHMGNMTMHLPFGLGQKCMNPFFSLLHSGNVEIHGNIIDLEGAMSFDDTDTILSMELDEPWLEEMVEGLPRDIISRASDMHRLLGGNELRGRYEPSLFAGFLMGKKTPTKFVFALTGMLQSYYQIADAEYMNEVIEDLMRICQKYAQKFNFPFGQTLKIFTELEKRKPFQETV